ncbi:hypothetical protein M422DRAFT_51818 [Sphaerobolus stellatus SS14]|uniref:Uncharacterized protein n=1 Tax=Sphaerobolus stellatus (strain SS14) TaxID=990650 RepID=A0A0C9VB63_SPHS4|nr:hypothetical protein M422DRAFT_51818 [Sphaerobolus stellatus SS14]
MAALVAPLLLRYTSWGDPPAQTGSWGLCTHHASLSFFAVSQPQLGATELFDFEPGAPLAPSTSGPSDPLDTDWTGPASWGSSNSWGVLVDLAPNPPVPYHWCYIDSKLWNGTPEGPKSLS